MILLLPIHLSLLFKEIFTDEPLLGSAQIEIFHFRVEHAPIQQPVALFLEKPLVSLFNILFGDVALLDRLLARIEIRYSSSDL